MSPCRAESRSQVSRVQVALRVSVEENDMLTFNNQRLTKRVEQLMVQLQVTTLLRRTPVILFCVIGREGAKWTRMGRILLWL